MLLAIVAFGLLASVETEVVSGSDPVVSPDGRRIAFQRFAGEQVSVGVCDAADGRNLRWIDAGGASAGCPNWTPSGGLVYSRRACTSTVFRAVADCKPDGYGLCLEEGGVTRLLTAGDFVDYSAALSPDGKTLWFATTRDVGKGTGVWKFPVSSNLARLDLADPTAVPSIASRPPNGKNSGFIGPAVSPDGRYLACGQLVHFCSGWRIVAARTSDVGDDAWHALTPRLMTAHSPRWHPDGEIICFTGFREGDPGWGVWTMNVRTGAMSRFADGENPCFSPSGAEIYFDRNGRIYRRAYRESDRPVGAASDADSEDYPQEDVAWRAGDSGISLAKLAFGTEETFFVRAKAKAEGRSREQELVRGDYGWPEVGFVLRLDGSKAVFSVASSSGAMSEVEAPVPPNGDCVVVGIRHNHSLYISVNSASPVRGWFADGRPMPLDHPSIFASEADMAEVGRGWPRDVPRLLGRRELFR